MAKILGLARLQRKINQLPMAVKDEIKAAMAEAATQTVALMKSLAPVKSGTLRNSIGWRWGGAPRGFGAVAVLKSALGKDLTLTIYAGGPPTTKAIRNSEKSNAPDFDYAPAQEFGTQTIRKSPFFYVSWRANKKTARARIRKGVRSAAKKVAAS